MNHPAIDYLLVALAATLALLLSPMDLPSPESRSAWFQSLAALAGALLAVGGVALTLVFAVTPSDRLQRVYDSTGPRLAELVLSCLSGLAIATAGFVGLFLVPATAAEVRNASTAALVAYACLRISRLWWLFRRVLRALMMAESPSDDAPGQTGEWTAPVVGPGDYSVRAKRARRRRSPDRARVSAPDR